ncbi:MAG TPA: MASE1 domain-containing protein, partial [Candidatus Dormibacteraeota bacterium]|nr:MASE1 domain-containing protein [Candidatus Dormibacteraeota bacterium]
MSAPRALDPARIALLATVYVVAGKLGLVITAVGGFATPVWAPTGLALAALVLFGHRLWPGVALGALLVNLWAGASAGVAVGISAGNTLEAVVGAYALRRVPGFDPGLSRLKDVLALIVLAALLSTSVSPTVGVSTLFLGGVLPKAQILETWRVWWVGDVVGDIVVAPLLMAAPALREVLRDRRRLWEGLGIVLLLVVVGQLVFWLEPSTPVHLVVRPVSFFPLLIWAALRFGPGGGAAATFLASMLAIWGTASGTGPYADRALAERLTLLQSFMANLAGTTLVLAAVMTERRRAESALREAYDELEARVQQRTTELREAILARDQMFGVVAHDLRNPLAAAQLASAAILRALPDDACSALARKAALTVEFALQRATRLIRDLLDVTRLEAGTLLLERRPLSARELVVEVADALAQVASEGALELQVEVELGLPPVLADNEHLFRAFSNLVENAAKFTPSGGR